MEKAIQSYASLFGNGKVSPVTFISSQKVNVCFIEMGNAMYLELVEPVDESSTVYSLKKMGWTYYHVGYEVKDFPSALEVLRQKRYKLINTFQSEAFGNRRCAFLISPAKHMI